MRSFAKLKRAARAAAEARGHRLEKFASVPAWALAMGAKSEAACETCGAWVQVITRPMPNEIDIAGSAVAVNCR